MNLPHLLLRMLLGRRLPTTAGRLSVPGLTAPMTVRHSTSAQAAVSFFEPMADPAFLAALRVVIDMGSWENSRFVLPGGQSGNPFSPHYADQLPLWQRGDGVPIAWSPEEVEAAARSMLTLLPTSPERQRRDT